jgi:hypothetical protein
MDQENIMSISIRPDPAAGKNEEQLAALEDTNQTRIRGWFDLAGIEPQYPCETATVIQLLQAVEYIVNGDVILGLLNDNAIPPVPRVNGRLAWSATNIVTAACALEARRKWKPFSTIHATKFSMVEKLQAIHEKEGSSAFSDLAAFDLDALLAMLIQVGGDAGTVSVLVEALRQKLKGAGVL